MKIEITEKEPKEQFPCIMKHEHGDVVLFQSDSEGTLMIRKGVGRGDYYGTSWNLRTCPKEWTPFTGTITLSN